jgi:riboflavin kinase / FMN adenylyltransferase
MQRISFEAHVIPGAGRGKKLGAPTLNVSLSDVPKDLKEGIYACFVTIDGTKHQAALHYGPRPVFKDSTSCEVYVLDQHIGKPPAQISIDIVAYLREVRDFPNPEALMAQIAQDVKRTRVILAQS